MDQYVIWNVERNMWWGPGYCGYVSNINNAGVYTEHQAYEICYDANVVKVEDIPVPYDMAIRIVPESRE